MRNFLRSIAGGLAGALMLVGALSPLVIVTPAAAQVAQGTQTYSNGSLVNPSAVLCSLAGAVNATQAAGTCTITPPQGFSVYITGIYVAACEDGTASISSIQQNFTTTNLNGLVLETSFISGSTITTNAGVPLCDRSPVPFMGAPIISAQPGVAVTVVPPAQAAHMSFPITVTGYFAK